MNLQKKDWQRFLSCMIQRKLHLKDKLIYIHFFIGDCDWYVAEYEKDRFWGYVILNGDTQNAEWGYFSFNELKNIKIHGFHEIDCESEKLWKVRKASEVDKISV